MKDTLILEPSQAGDLAQGRKELKDEQLFARLIGAAVLLALAVIILPFVLDGSGSQREYEYAETLPVEPERPVVEKSFSSRQPVSRPVGQTLEPVIEPVTRPVTRPVAPAPAEISVNVPAATPTSNLQPVVIRTTEQLANSVAVAADSGRDARLSAGEVQGSNRVSSLESRPLQSGWNIQVASFVRDENAVKLVEKLRARNLPAYANRVQGSTRTVIRVLVGPYSNQIDALALQNDIDRDYRVESLMVRGR